MNIVKNEILSPYELTLKEVKEGNIDPFDVDLGYLIELFQQKASELKGSDYFIEAGLFLQAASELLKLKVQTIFPQLKKEKKKITIKEVKEILEQGQEEIDTLDWLYSYTPQVGRPKGKIKTEKPKRISLKEFFQKELPLHRNKNVDWDEEAKRVYEEIRKGVFKIRSWIDLIAFLYAYMEYEDFEVKDIKEFI